MYKFEIQIFIQAVDNLLNRFLKIIIRYFDGIIQPVPFWDFPLLYWYSQITGFVYSIQ